MKALTKKERVRRTLAQEPTDRPPVTLWWHDFLREWDIHDLQAATLDSYRRFDWDIVKLNPRGTYFAEAWGATFTRPDKHQFPRPLNTVVREPSDLLAVRPVDARGGVFGEHLQFVRNVTAVISAEVDIIHTVFSPLGILGMLCGSRDGSAPPDDAVQAFAAGQTAVKQLALEDPAALHSALAAIATTIEAYAIAALESGAAGLFYAPMTWTSRRVCTEEFYASFGRPYDLAILKSVRHAALNVLHVCGNENMLESMLDYPVAVVNWADDGVGNPSLREIRRLQTSKVVMGGVDPAITFSSSAAEAGRAIEAKLGGDARGMIVAGGCAMWPRTPLETFDAIVAGLKRPGAVYYT